MPLKVFRIVLISFIFLCCKCQNSKEKSENLIPPCANKTVLKTFKNEPGFIRGGNHPSVDALFYYYFEPLVHYNEIPEILIFKAVGGGFDAGDHNLEQYYGKLVRVNGEVTNCTYWVTGWGKRYNGEGPVDIEYKVMNLTSIKQVKECKSCEDKEYIIKVLKDEPAYIKKDCFESFGGKEKYYFGFENTKYDFFYFGLFPCNELPEEFRKEGLSVKISGNVTNCNVRKGYTNLPHSISVPVYIFELESIEICK